MDIWYNIKLLCIYTYAIIVDDFCWLNILLLPFMTNIDKREISSVSMFPELHHCLSGMTSNKAPAYITSSHHSIWEGKVCIAINAWHSMTRPVTTFGRRPTVIYWSPENPNFFCLKGYQPENLNHIITHHVKAYRSRIYIKYNLECSISSVTDWVNSTFFW